MRYAGALVGAWLVIVLAAEADAAQTLCPPAGESSMRQASFRTG
jgi:hypothetical protein